MNVPHWIRLAAGAAVVAATLAGCSKSAQSYLDRGNAYMEKGNVDAAVLEYRNAVAKDGMFAPARLKLAEAYLRQGNGAGAVAESVRAADLLPNDVDAQLRAGALLLAAGRPEDAKGRADKALAVNPKNVEALVLRANGLARLKDLDGALKEMQQALSLDPRSSIQTTMGLIQAEKGNLLEAEAAFRQAVATDPKSVTAQVALGQFLWSTGKAADAEGAFKAALALEPGNELANRAVAAFYLRIGPRRRGRALFQEDRGSLRRRGGEARACGLLHGTEAAVGCHGCLGEAQCRAAGTGRWPGRRSPTSSTPEGRPRTPSERSTKW